MDRTLNPGKESFGIPYHVTTGVPDWIFYIFIILVIYVAIRVIIGHRKHNLSKIDKKEREIAATEELLGDKIKKKAE